MKLEDAAEEEASYKKGKDIEDRLGISLNDPEVIKAATKIQAGFRGVQTRKSIKKRKPPEIVVDETTATEYSDCTSENSYTYTYEDEDEESESLEDRPASPPTAVSNFSKDTISIAGFKASALIGSWVSRRKNAMQRPMTVEEENEAATKIQAGYRGMRTRESQRNTQTKTIAGFKATMAIGAWAKRRKVRQFKPLEGEEEDEVATKIQAGYRGMKVREEVARKDVENNKEDKKKQQEDSGTEISGSVSPDDGRVTAVEKRERNGVDSGTSFSSREATPRLETKKSKSIDEDYNENFEDASLSGGSGEESDASDYSGQDSETDSEGEIKIKDGKTPFVLLKRLVGIMQVGTAKSAFTKKNKVGIDEDTCNEDETSENVTKDNQDKKEKQHSLEDE